MEIGLQLHKLLTKKDFELKITYLKKTLNTLLILCLLTLTGCDDPHLYESQINAIMNYKNENCIRLFLPVERNKDNRYIPKYIELKYVDQNRLLDQIEIERKEELLRYLRIKWYSDRDEIMEKVEKSPLKQKNESEETYTNRILGLIPEVKVGKTLDRTQTQIHQEVWDRYSIQNALSKIGPDDLLFWITYYGTIITIKDNLRFSLKKTEPETNSSSKFLIKEAGFSDSLYLGFEQSFFPNKKHYLLVFKNFKKQPFKRYTLEIKGKYIAKPSWNLEYHSKNKSEEDIAMETWDKQEIWWYMDRTIDFYFDEKGNCHFENEQHLFDETTNPPPSFRSTQKPEMLQVPQPK